MPSSSEEQETSSSSIMLTYLRPDVERLRRKLVKFVEEECIAAEIEYDMHLKQRHGVRRWTNDAVPPCVERLKHRAKELGLWNLFIPQRLVSKIPLSYRHRLGPSIEGGLTYREYGILCEVLGRCPHIAPEACNASAPDTGNMEVLLEFGTPFQQEKYLVPLLEGKIRSTFLMTEPDVASSDPTNLETRLIVKKKRGQKVEYELRGRKWWSTGALDPRCKLALVVAKMDYSQLPQQNRTTSERNKSTKHGMHTIVVVEMPNPGVVVKRPLRTFGYDDAPSGHAEVLLNGVRLTDESLVLGEGQGFAVSQARLGPGRIHHCMRAVGMAARCYELMLQRTLERKAFGKLLWEHGGCQEMIADSAIDLEAARLMTLSCAAAMDDVGPRNARDKIAAIKVAVPRLTYDVIDRAVQVFGGAGVSDDDYVLARFLAALRTLRIADGPDAVHKRTVAKLEIKKAKQRSPRSSSRQSRL